MPARNLPRTLPSALRVMRRCREQFQMTPAPAEQAIGAAIWAELNPANAAGLLRRLETEMGEAATAQAAAGPATADKQVAAVQLLQHCSHFHQVLDLAIARGRWPASVRTFYGRAAASSVLPAMGTEAELDAVADNIVRGEALRQAAEGGGYAPMTNPTAGDVGSLYSTWRNARLTAAGAAQTADEEAEDVSELLPAALALCLDIFDSVEFFYRKETPDSSRRRKCRRWGVEYLYSSGETPDDPVPVAPAAPLLTPGAPGSRSVTAGITAVPDASGYRLYGRGPGSSTPALLAQTDLLTLTVTLESATSGEDWIFTLKAFNDTGESPPSPEAVAALP